MMPSFPPSRLREVGFQADYRSAQDDLLESFYVPALNASVCYDRAVGYFRATLLAVAGVAFSAFARRGGSVRLVCSPSLEASDIEAISRGFERRTVDLSERLRLEMDRLLESPENRPFLELLATLVAAERLEIKIAQKLDGGGLFHAKVGVFQDSSGDAVSFEGSSNESWSAWMPGGNHEGFGVFLSWEAEREAQRVLRHQAYFNALWHNEVADVDVVAFPDAVQKAILSHANPDGIDAAAEAVVRTIGLVVRPEVGTLPGILMKHQTDVLSSWREHGMRGIIKHATGAGKTLTALEAVRGWVGEGKPALVLVPTRVLMEQWLGEIRHFLGDQVTVLEVGGHATKEDWSPHVVNWSEDSEGYGSRVTLATMASGADRVFLSRLQDGEHLLLVADEVHRIGSDTWSGALAIRSGAALGLSATPERYGDPDGTKQILDYFGPVLSPEVTLQDAIAIGRLVPYEYHVRFTTLTEDEQSEWLELTDEIARGLARTSDGEKTEFAAMGPWLKLLFIKRARVLKKASSKTSVAVDLVSELYSEGAAWLVYCEDVAQLDAVLDGLRRRGLSPDPYHSAMNGTAALNLEGFTRRGGILVAIRCLDEGVDIPRVDHALILASSTNPRQFIQRRGRVLRKAPGKTLARIYDLFTLPIRVDSADTSTDPILRSELARAWSFAMGAANLSARTELELVVKDFGLDKWFTEWSWESDTGESSEVDSDG